MQSYKIYYFPFCCIMLSMHFSKKVKEKVRQENPKWTFIKCPK